MSVKSFASAALVAVLIAALAGAGAVLETAHAAPAKKRCHVVKKKVRGKVRRVRVCAKKRKPPTKPKNVSLTLEQGRATSATVGEGGGTVSARAASGATMTVAIPAGALSADTKVTVTPVAKLRGAGRVRLLAGAELGPEGTVLTKPATLSFQLRGRAARAFGVAWFGRGTNAHRYPLKRNGRRVTLRLVHFSGAGVAQGSPALLPQLETALTVAYAREVRPLLRQATTDDTAFTPAVDAADRWLKAVQLVGLQERFATFWREAHELLEKVFRNALEKASERCRNHDLKQLDRIAKIGQKAESLAFDVGPLTTFERIERCARFEVDVDFDWVATLDVQAGDGSQRIYDSLHVKAARVPLTVVAEHAQIEGEGPLVPTAWHETFSVTSTDYSCTIESNGPATPKEPLRAILELDVSETPPELYLDIDPGDVTTPRSPGCGSTNPPPPPVYTGAWDVLYGAKKRPDGRFRFHLTDFVGQEIYALFGPETTTGSTQFSGWSGTLRLTLRHTPAG